MRLPKPDGNERKRSSGGRYGDGKAVKIVRIFMSLKPGIFR
jgi:hypothetical protein